MDVNLVLCKNSGKLKTFPLPSSVTIVGRRQECDLCIPLPIVSRKHCELNLDNGTLSIRDLASRNGTYLNGSRIENESLINPGDKIQIGPLTFIAQINNNPSEITPDMITDTEHPGQTTLEEKKFIAKSEQNSGIDDDLDNFSDLNDLDDLDDIDIDEDESSTEMLDLNDNSLQ